MSPAAAEEEARKMLEVRNEEKARLDAIHLYFLGRQRLPSAPSGSPDELLRIAKLARVNIMEIVVNSVAQAMYVDGYRQKMSSEDAPAWDIWQANKMDARQVGVHRSALTYGTSYVSVLPGVVLPDTQTPVIKGWSPRRMTVVYGENDDYPEMAMSTEPGRKLWHYRLFDSNFVYILEGEESTDTVRFVEARKHGVGVVPVIRFLNTMDLDEDNRGEVEPLEPLQDQIDLTTFSLLVAQHYGAFRQRWAIGWVAESESALLKAGASRLWTIEDSPEDVKLGEFEQTQLTGYLESREASIRHAASLSQTPAHELLGQLVNLSAEALVAAEASQRRKVVEKQQSFGESWEQVLAIAGRIGGVAVNDDAQVRWRDTESRALASTVDALGKMVLMLGIPPQELWERIPNVSQTDIERWKETAKENDQLAQFIAQLDQQNAGEEEPRGNAS